MIVRVIVLENLQISQSSNQAISLAINSRTLAHSIILHGASERARFYTAKAIAQAIVCTGEDKPCQMCGACKKIIDNIHPDVTIIDGYASVSAIKVDAIRQLKTKALLFPNDGEKSVFIIHGAHKMNVQAQNALLKIFEEPADHVCFILTCESASTLISTITSRARAYFLGNETKVIEDGEETALNVAADLISCLCSNSELAFIKKTAPLHKDKILFKEVVTEFPVIFRDAIIAKNGSSKLMTNETELANRLANTFTIKQLVEFMQQSQDFIALFDKVPNHNLFITRVSSLFYSIKSC